MRRVDFASLDPEERRTVLNPLNEIKKVFCDTILELSERYPVISKMTWPSYNPAKSTIAVEVDGQLVELDIPRPKLPIKSLSESELAVLNEWEFFKSRNASGITLSYRESFVGVCGGLGDHKRGVKPGCGKVFRLVNAHTQPNWRHPHCCKDCATANMESKNTVVNHDAIVGELKTAVANVIKKTAPVTHARNESSKTAAITALKDALAKLETSTKKAEEIAAAGSKAKGLEETLERQKKMKAEAEKKLLL